MKLDRPIDLPPPLEERFAQVQVRAAEVDCDLPPSLAGSAARVLVASGFVCDVLTRQPLALIRRVEDQAPVSPESLAAVVGNDEITDTELMARLRRLRNVELAAIAWRDIANQVDLDRTLADLSALADGMITIALEQARRSLESRFGRPGPLLVLAMGKLGGYELNFSSDIDLVLLFADADDGASDDRVEYFRRLSQRMIRFLDERTADGIVYRVDTRLRPFGNSGPLALSIGALESYLMQHGRDWERYAYVKARLISGMAHERELFDEVLTPFVYRRYLDFGVFDALRQMKRLISEDVSRKERHDNIKLGRGGIREIEFIAQLFQLLRGGQEASLRARHLLTVLEELAAFDLIERQTADDLAESYRFLRRTENCLQALDDRQTHELPVDEVSRARLAYAAGFASWAGLAETIERHRDRVQTIFDAIQWGGETEEDPRAESIALAWDSGRLAESTGIEALAALDELRGGALYERMDEISRQRLGAFVGVLVPGIEGRERPADAIGRIMPVIRSICRRSAYLSLLLENPAALERLLDLAEQSAMLTRHVAEHPLLLDELLDRRLFDAAPTREEIEAALERQIRHVADDDLEGLLDALRDFQRAAVFRVAVADRFGGLPLMKVSDRLTDIAELVIDFALKLALRELESKHGVPMHGKPGALEPSSLIVVAYGKLGGLELGYGSDLDLVFLHDSTGTVQETTGPAVIDNQRYFVRLVQRIIHYLSVQTSSGRLYEIDTRLRPDGASGLLVASLTSFERYQREEAWTWEHQALLRSRSVAGRDAVRLRFEQIRAATLTDAVRRDDLREQVTTMRRRMRQELAAGDTGRFDIKQDSGGLADIEFLIDYLVLANAADYPALVEFPDNVRQLEALEASGLMPAERCAGLKADYLALRAETHLLALNDGGRTVDPAGFTDLRQRICALWEEIFGESPD